MTTDAYRTTPVELPSLVSNIAGTPTPEVAPTVSFGTGSPEAVVTAPVGSIYTDVSGHVLYTKSSGTGNTGWTGISGSVNLTTSATGTLQAAQEPAHTGDVTNSAGSLALAIGANKVVTAMIADAAVTLAKIANVAGSSILGTGVSAGAPQALTGTQVTALLDLFNSGTQGLVSPSGGGSTNYLQASGSWAAPFGSNYSGTGSPEGVVTAAVGANYIDITVTAAPVRYCKTTGSGNTGWVQA